METSQHTWEFDSSPKKYICTQQLKQQMGYSAKVLPLPDAISWLISKREQTTEMQTHRILLYSWEKRQIRKFYKGNDPGLISVILISLGTPRIAAPRSWEPQNPPYPQMGDLSGRWGCGWKRCWCQDAEKERLWSDVWIENWGGGVIKAGGEVSVGQLKVLMGVL